MTYKCFFPFKLKLLCHNFNWRSHYYAENGTICSTVYVNMINIYIVERALEFKSLQVFYSTKKILLADVTITLLLKMCCTKQDKQVKQYSL